MSRLPTWESIFRGLLTRAGVEVDGARPYDFKVRDARVYRRVLLDPGLAFGESYMDGWWDCDQLDELVAKLLRSRVDRMVPHLGHPFLDLASRVSNLQSRRRAPKVAESHYDLDSEIFRRMLDRRMVYTCAYWRDADTLDAAQEAKLDLICRKLELQPGMRLLDIGCGFGPLMRFAAERYGAHCVGYSLSKEQTRVGRELCRGLPVEFRLEDYRAITGTFDRVVSVEMIEAVGHRNLRTFMQTVAKAMSDDGVFLLQGMASNTTKTQIDPWFHKYIFPNGELPSMAQLGRASEDLFTFEDCHNFGPDYDKTLLAWHARFMAAWPILKARHSERFRRMWEFYLLAFAGSFRARTVDLWQIVMTKPGRRPPLARLT